jgi:hypothetical protein
VSQERRRRAEIRKRAAQRVEAVFTCVNLLCPDLSFQEQKALASKVLDLCRGEAPAPIRINAAQIQEIVWRNTQCVNRHCPMVLFSRDIADELNEFFSATE